LKKLAYSCVIKFNDLTEKKLEKSEGLQMNDSDNFSNLLRDYNNLIEKSIVNDALSNLENIVSDNDLKYKKDNKIISLK
jgi:hypothetical protein